MRPGAILHNLIERKLPKFENEKMLTLETLFYSSTARLSYFELNKLKNLLCCFIRVFSWHVAGYAATEGSTTKSEIYIF